MRWNEGPAAGLTIPSRRGLAFPSRRGLGFTLLILISQTACQVSAAPPRRLNSAPDRRICGWDEGSGSPVGPSQPALVGAGARVAVLRPSDEARFEDLRRALAPARDTLVRVKLAIDGDDLLAVTIPHRPAVMPPSDTTESTIVGHRKVTRPKGGLRDRIADLQLDGGEVTVFVENDKPGGRAMATAALADHLRGVEPSVGVFTLGVSDDTTWPQLRGVLVAAACYDRQPGEEPHEVIVPP